MPADITIARDLLTSTCGFGVISAEQMQRYLAKLAVEEEDFIEIARRFGRPLGPVRSER